MDITLQVTEHEDNGRTRYDIHYGDGHKMYIWGDANPLAKLTRFANAAKPEESDRLRFIRRILKQQLEQRTVNQILNYLSTPRQFTVSDITVQESGVINGSPT